MRVNEIFYSLQGEGHFAGVPAVFLRLSGCNLCCDFCDTLHQPFTQMTDDAIVDQLSAFPSRHVVVTGGEPAMQLTADFVAKLHARGFYVQVETNGSLPLPDNIDWVTCSPKQAPIALSRIDELKVLFFDRDDHPEQFDHIPAQCRSLQPCDSGSELRNRHTTAAAIRYVLDHPQWKLSLQTHKMLQIR